MTKTDNCHKKVGTELALLWANVSWYCINVVGVAYNSQESRMADCYFHGHGFSGPCERCEENRRAGREEWDNDGSIYHPIFNPAPPSPSTAKPPEGKSPKATSA